MGLRVKIEFCTNCHMHAWCSQHNEEKYIAHFQKLKQSIEMHFQQGEVESIERMDIPKHFLKVTPYTSDNKYFDSRKQEHVIFPKLGSFEIYVDEVLIFSKLRDNRWPNYQNILKTISLMLQSKKESKDLCEFQVGYLEYKTQALRKQKLKHLTALFRVKKQVNQHKIGNSPPHQVQKGLTQQNQSVQLAVNALDNHSMEVPPNTTTSKVNRHTTKKFRYFNQLNINQTIGEELPRVSNSQRTRLQRSLQAKTGDKNLKDNAVLSPQHPYDPDLSMDKDSSQEKRKLYNRYHLHEYSVDRNKQLEKQREKYNRQLNRLREEEAICLSKLSQIDSMLGLNKQLDQNAAKNNAQASTNNEQASSKNNVEASTNTQKSTYGNVSINTEIVKVKQVQQQTDEQPQLQSKTSSKVENKPQNKMQSKAQNKTSNKVEAQKISNKVEAQIHPKPTTPIKLNLSISPANKFFSYYEVNGNGVCKISGEDNWHPLTCAEILPPTGSYYFIVNVVFSNVNNIEIGILPHDYPLEEDIICQKAISYHLHNGKIHDSRGVKQEVLTLWREPQPNSLSANIPLNTPICIKVLVDMDKQTIEWLCGEEALGKSVITNYLKYKKCVPYINMIHQDDLIAFNDQNAVSNKVILQGKQSQKIAEIKTPIHQKGLIQQVKAPIQVKKLIPEVKVPIQQIKAPLAPIQQIKAPKTPIHQVKAPKTPIQQIKVPILEIKTQNAQVKVPINQVKAPTIQVKTQNAEIKTPINQVKAPTVQMKTQNAQVKAPINQVKAPTIQVKTQNAEIKTPIQVKTQNAEIKIPIQKVKPAISEVKVPIAEPSLKIQNPPQIQIPPQIQPPPHLQAPPNMYGPHTQP